MKLTPQEVYLLNNSPERVLNTAINLILGIKPRSEDEDERRGVNLDDLDAIKPIVTSLWLEKQSDLIRKIQDERHTALRKGGCECTPHPLESPADRGHILCHHCKVRTKDPITYSR